MIPTKTVVGKFLGAMGRGGGGGMTYTFVSDTRGRTWKGTGSQSGFNQVLRAGKRAKTGTAGGCSQEVISHLTAFST